MSETERIEAGPATYSVSLPTFEGPLDLLLHLCQKHELDILDIPIGFITEKYLEYLALMTLLDLDVASEYLVMAATLAHIKSKMLLPAPPPGQEDEAIAEDEEDPREALIKRLLEYQKYKHAAAELAERGVAGQDVFPRGAPIEEAVTTGVAPLADIPLYRLLEAFQGVLARSSVKLTHDVVADRISITDRIHELADMLKTRGRVLFDELFTGQISRFDLVITFLALLEMTRLRMTRLYQEEPLAPLHVEMVLDSSEDNSASNDLSPPEMGEPEATS
jgi:segregation and condensation protein A